MLRWSFREENKRAYGKKWLKKKRPESRRKWVSYYHGVKGMKFKSLLPKYWTDGCRLSLPLSKRKRRCLSFLVYTLMETSTSQTEQWRLYGPHRHHQASDHSWFHEVHRNTEPWVQNRDLGFFRLWLCHLLATGTSGISLKAVKLLLFSTCVRGKNKPDFTCCCEKFN